MQRCDISTRSQPELGGTGDGGGGEPNLRAAAAAAAELPGSRKAPLSERAAAAADLVELESKRLRKMMANRLVRSACGDSPV